jgi:hypothetical protein
MTEGWQGLDFGKYKIGIRTLCDFEYLSISVLFCVRKRDSRFMSSEESFEKKCQLVPSHKLGPLPLRTMSIFSTYDISQYVPGRFEVKDAGNGVLCPFIST